MLYVPDEIVFQILKENLDGVAKEKNIIVEGYPKTPYQSMALIKSGIIPDLFVVVNYEDEGCKDFAKKKFNETDNEVWSEVSETDRGERSLEYLSQYQM